MALKFEECLFDTSIFVCAWLYAATNSSPYTRFQKHGFQKESFKIGVFMVAKNK